MISGKRHYWWVFKCLGMWAPHLEHHFPPLYLRKGRNLYDRLSGTREHCQCIVPCLPPSSSSTFCRSAMACFRFLACSNFSCRTMSCFFWSRSRMMWATSGSWYMSKARSSKGEMESHLLGAEDRTQRQRLKHENISFYTTTQLYLWNILNTIYSAEIRPVWMCRYLCCEKCWPKGKNTERPPKEWDLRWNVPWGLIYEKKNIFRNVFSSF